MESLVPVLASRSVSRTPSWVLMHSTYIGKRSDLVLLLDRGVMEKPGTIRNFIHVAQCFAARATPCK